MQNLLIQVSVLKDSDNFSVKLNEICFSYVFLNGQPYQTYTDKEGFIAYMSQLNFAMHCATTACGLSLEGLFADDKMLRSIYRFHVVFQARNILNNPGLRLLCVDEFNPFKSHYNLVSYRKLCGVFNIELSTDWWYKYNEKGVIQRLCNGKLCDWIDPRS